MSTPRARRRLVTALLPAAAGALVATTALVAQTPPATRPAAAPTTAPAAAPSTAPATGPAAKLSPDTVILTIGGENVTLAEYDLFVTLLPPDEQMEASQPGPARRQWAESFANMKLLAREAVKRKLDQTPEVQRMLALSRDQVLATGMARNFQENVDEAVLRKHFEENRAQIERVSARHILVRFAGSRVPLRPGQKDLTDAEAKTRAEALLARVKGGEDFAAVAKAESDDTGSGRDGGDLGSFTRARMVAPFADAAFKLKENEISPAPVRSDFGYHVIQVTGRFDTYEKLADVLKEQLGPQQANQQIKALRQQVPITFNDAVLGPAMPQFPDIGPAAPATTAPTTTAPATAPAPR